MDLVLEPCELAGKLRAVPSKSQAHRLIMLAALADATTEIDCAASSADIEATIGCMKALGARISRTRRGLRVVGRPRALRQAASPTGVVLDCGESGSTLRFLLPVVAALGCGGSFQGQGRLGSRPLTPLKEELEAHGVTLSADAGFPLELSGRLSGGTFTLPGNVSSQYVSGLLMAAPLVGEALRVLVSEPVESEPYIQLTIQALARFGIGVSTGTTEISGTRYRSFEVEEGELRPPETLAVEGDWSNAAFWLAAGAHSARGVEVTGLDASSAQGDRAMLAALARAGARVGRSKDAATVRRQALRAFGLDVSSIPDLVPPLAALAASASGTTRLTHAGRLRLKESDRLATVSAAVKACGGMARIEGDDLVIEGRELSGGSVEAANDHRIAMMAAVLASASVGPVVVRGAECVSKSYPGFWEDYASLGGDIREV